MIQSRKVWRWAELPQYAFLALVRATGFEFASEVMFGHSNLKSKPLLCREISRTLGCNFKIFGQLKYVQSSLFMVFSTALHFV